MIRIPRILILGKWPEEDQKGGVASFIRALISGISKDDEVDSYLISFGREGRIIKKGGTKIVILKARLLDYLLPFLPILRISFKIKKFDPDYINVQGINISPYLIYALFVYPRSRKSITVHSSWSWELTERGVIHPNSLLDKILTKLETISIKKFNPVLVVTPNLLKTYPSAKLLERPVEIPVSQILGTDNSFSHESPILKIVHLPTQRSMKGTEKIIDAIDSIITEGAAIKFRIAGNLSHSDALNAIQESDIIIDQINDKIGTYGIVSIESMALGKTTICYLNQEFNRMYPFKIPIVTPEYPTARSLADCIRFVINEDETKRQKRSIESVEYVKKMHSPEIIAKRLIGFLQER